MDRAMELINPGSRVERAIKAVRDFIHVPEPTCVQCRTHEQEPDSFWCGACRGR